MPRYQLVPAPLQDRPQSWLERIKVNRWSDWKTSNIQQPQYTSSASRLKKFYKEPSCHHYGCTFPSCPWQQYRLQLRPASGNNPENQPGKLGSRVQNIHRSSPETDSIILLGPSAARGGSCLPGQLHAVVWFLPSRAWRNVFLFPTLDAPTFSNGLQHCILSLCALSRFLLCLSFLYFHLQTSAPALTSLSATLRIIKVRFITNVASADSLALVTAAHVVHCRDPSNRPTCYSDDARSHRWRCLSKLLLGNP